LTQINGAIAASGYRIGMPAYRYIIKTPVLTTGGTDAQVGYLYTPNDASAVYFAKAKLTDPSQTLELWQGQRRVNVDAAPQPAVARRERS
jgi:hypothetical protein